MTTDKNQAAGNEFRQLLAIIGKNQTFFEKARFAYFQAEYAWKKGGEGGYNPVA